MRAARMDLARASTRLFHHDRAILLQHQPLDGIANFDTRKRGLSVSVSEVWDVSRQFALRVYGLAEARDWTTTENGIAVDTRRPTSCDRCSSAHRQTLRPEAGRL